ncbi:hypothetical protein GGR58DRAFT_496445 [Xylaria digitata]|nr:hypothetical protein GGR58DRAFT_496445 [Xylaria digitata]
MSGQSPPPFVLLAAPLFLSSTSKKHLAFRFRQAETCCIAMPKYIYALCSGFKVSNDFKRIPFNTVPTLSTFAGHD